MKSATNTKALKGKSNVLKKLKMSRRHALRGVVSGASVAMWLPILDAMTDDNGEAFAQGGALPVSFGVWFWGNGYQRADWTPSDTGQGNDWQLTTNLEAFAPVKSKMNLITGMNMFGGEFAGHGPGAMYVLAGGNHARAGSVAEIDYGEYGYEQPTSTQSAPTIDQVAADFLQDQEAAPFKSLETGTLPYTGMAMGTISTSLAHRGPYDVLPPERDPSRLYDRLFGNSETPPGTLPSSVVTELRRSSLDAVTADVNRLKLQVGAVDAARLDSHFESLREVENRLAAMADPNECATPTQPGTIDIDNKMQVGERNQVINSLVVAALACNLTRVYSHMWSGARDDNTYPIIDIDDEHHSLTHAQAAGNRVASVIERYIMEQYADLIIQMDNTSIGAGTLLDHTINLGVTDVTNPANHRHSDYHSFVFGGGGGKIAGDQHLRFEGSRKLTELHLTVFKALGLPMTEWGNWDRTSRTVDELLV